MNYVIAVLCYSGYLLSLLWFCERYLGEFRFRKGLTGLLFLTGGIFFISPFWENTSDFLRVSISHFLFFCLVCFSFRKSAEEKLLAAAVMTAVKTMTWNFVSSFFSMIVLTGMHFRYRGEAVISLETDYLISAASYGTVILAVYFFAQSMKTRWEYLVKSRYVLSVPLLFLVVVVDIVNWGASNGVMVKGEGFNLYYNQIFSHTAVCLLTLLCACIACLVFFGIGRIYREQKQTEQYIGQVMYYKALNEQYQKMERLRHDMKNHVLSLYGLYQRQEWEALGSYLEQMLESGGIREKKEATGSSTVDALLYHKRAVAEKKHICWECEVQIPKECPIEEFDLCVLFGNILDNAIEGAGNVQEEERFLSIYAGKVKKCFLLVVKNSTRLGHEREIKPGIGLFNIKETAERHQGIFKLEIKEHIFEVSVLFPMP